MTPIFKAAADDDGVITLKQVSPEPPVHWLWKWLYYGLPAGAWLTCLVGVLVSG
jgi:hypothetical protein